MIDRLEYTLSPPPSCPTNQDHLTYNPDWAVLIESDEGERLYFVVETKASTLVDDLRGTENAKIQCGKAHFKALQRGEAPPQYEVATSVDQILASIGGG